jgi:hypothetical protein
LARKHKARKVKISSVKEEEGPVPDGTNFDRSPGRSDFSVDESVDSVAEEAARAVYEAIREIAASDGAGVSAAEEARTKIVRFANGLRRDG